MRKIHIKYNMHDKIGPAYDAYENGERVCGASFAPGLVTSGTIAVLAHQQLTNVLCGDLEFSWEWEPLIRWQGAWQSDTFVTILVLVAGEACAGYGLEYNAKPDDMLGDVEATFTAAVENVVENLCTTLRLDGHQPDQKEAMDTLLAPLVAELISRKFMGQVN